MDEYRVALEVAGPAAMFARPDTLPARERGLKLAIAEERVRKAKSLPARERGLKQVP